MENDDFDGLIFYGKPPDNVNSAAFAAAEADVYCSARLYSLALQTFAAAKLVDAGSESASVKYDLLRARALLRAALARIGDT